MKYRRLSGVWFGGALFAAAFAVAIFSQFAYAQFTAQQAQRTPSLTTLTRSSPLSIVPVRGRFACLFAESCSVRVETDFVDEIEFLGAAGRLQSRVLSVGERGAPAEGLRAFLYRLDLSRPFNREQQQCVEQVTIDVGEFTQFDFNGDQRPDDVLVIASGGLGSIGPVRAVQSGDGAVTFFFSGLCGGGGPNQARGISSFFFGVLAAGETATRKATIRDNFGNNTQVQSRGIGSVSAQDEASNTPPAAVIARNDFVGTTRRLDFENLDPDLAGPPVGFGRGVTSQYRSSDGVTFGAGFSRQPCTQQNLSTASADISVYCRYPGGASGDFAGFFDGGGRSGILTLSFDELVNSVSMRINPTGGGVGDEFRWVLTGFGADGGRQVVERGDFRWGRDAFTWPTTATIKSGAAGFRRVTIELYSEKNEGRDRFLIDDLEIEYAPARSPLASLIFSADENRAVGDPVLAITPEEEEAAKRLRRFKPTPRWRFPIDWDAALSLEAAQTDASITPAAIDSPADLNRAALPVILPQTATDTVGLAVQQNGDSFSVGYSRDGYAYEIFGTRSFFETGSAPAALPSGLETFETEFGVGARWSLFGGASYRLMRFCEEAATDPPDPCWDQSTLAREIDALTIAIGSTGRARP